jgi:hypothetical protein
MMVLRMRFFQDELLNLAACRLGRFFKEQSFLMMSRKTPFSYPSTDVDHGTIQIGNTGIME